MVYLPVYLPTKLTTAMKVILKYFFQGSKNEDNFVISDRYGHERKRWHADLGVYPVTCLKHLSRDVRANVTPDTWSKRGSSCLNNLLFAGSEKSFFAALQEMKDSYPTIVAYLEKSERDQQVWSAIEIMTKPYLEYSHSHYALLCYMKEKGITLPHNKIATPMVSTNNLVEAANGSQKANGIRFEGPLSWVQRMSAKQSEILNDIFYTLSRSPHVLIPNVHEVYDADRRIMSQFPIETTGQFGFFELRHLSRKRRDGKRSTNVNVHSFSCDDVDCTQRVVGTCELCPHPLSALQSPHDDRLSKADFFETHYPAFYLKDSIVNMLSGFSFIPPNSNDMRQTALMPIYRAPAVNGPTPIGQPKNNSIRFQSCGEYPRKKNSRRSKHTK